MAKFIYNDLCTNDEMRQALDDVQYHPVKMILFIKMKTEEARDTLVNKLEANQGVMWSEYGVRVRGHSLDANVKVIRILGVSPETSAEDIENTFNEIGVGEVMDIRKGMLDSRRLPGVTNGTWLARVRITDPDKAIPPYVNRREEVCWKCGSSDHIGDKCKDQEGTFEEVFGNTDGSSKSWAAIVKGQSTLNANVLVRRDEIAKQIKENNEQRARERQALEDKEQEKIDAARRAREEAISEASRVAAQHVAEQSINFDSDFSTEGDEKLLKSNSVEVSVSDEVLDKSKDDSSSSEGGE